MRKLWLQAHPDEFMLSQLNLQVLKGRKKKLHTHRSMSSDQMKAFP